MTVGQLDATMSGVELVYWAAFFKLEDEDREAGTKSKARKRRTDDDDD